jgi:hypothetical protein
MDYYKLFKAQVEVINVHGGCFGYHPRLFQKKLMEMKVEMTLLPGDPGYHDALNALKRRARNVQCKEYV